MQHDDADDRQQQRDRGEEASGDLQRHEVAERRHDQIHGEVGHHVPGDFVDAPKDRIALDVRDYVQPREVVRVIGQERNIGDQQRHGDD